MENKQPAGVVIVKRVAPAIRPAVYSHLPATSKLPLSSPVSQFWQTVVPGLLHGVPASGKVPGYVDRVAVDETPVR
jgi:hypothetical protein